VCSPSGASQQTFNLETSVETTMSCYNVISIDLTQAGQTSSSKFNPFLGIFLADF